jgi:hypothetical protein
MAVSRIGLGFQGSGTSGRGAPHRLGTQGIEIDGEDVVCLKKHLDIASIGTIGPQGDHPEKCAADHDHRTRNSECLPIFSDAIPDFRGF